MLTQMRRHENPPRISWSRLARRPYADMGKIEKKVKKILQRVKREGEEAVLYYNKKFDKSSYQQLKVSWEEIHHAEKRLSAELKNAIRTAYKNIWAFHEAQRQSDITLATMPGVVCMRRSVPIDTVGLYIPGGTAPLFSTLLMLAIPAKVAGCRLIVVCTPPDKQGNVHPAILFIASLLRLEHVYKAGGAQAIAAMTYGTETIPPCDKIFGPGNQYVTVAKMLVHKEGTAIDLPAGPSELIVLADQTARPDFVAADLLSQAEHGPDSQVLLVTTSRPLLNEVKKQLKQQAPRLPRYNIVKESMQKSHAVYFANPDDAIDFVNFYAPEHLILAVENPDPFIEKIKNAGSVFIGHYTPESVGDYAAGTNHTLPTGGFAKGYSGVSLDSFLKKITFQRLSPEGLRALGPVVEAMAEAEGLAAHKQAVSIRLKSV